MDPDSLGSLGVRLMRGLAEQMHGTISLENNQGAIVTVVFQPNALLVH
jgi:two-component sensor histidine kinase